MFRLSSTHRIVLGLVALTVSALLVCGMLGLIPSIQQTESISRQGFCETTAVSFMALAPRMDQDSLEQTLEQLKERRSDVQSVGVRRADGEIVISSANHVDLWESTGDNPANECEFIVPIRAENELWGRLEVHFQPYSGLSFLGISVRPDVAISIVMAFGLFGAFTMYLKRVLKHLSPDRVIPNRVRDALNALAEGLLVLDGQLNVVLANSSFSRHTEIESDRLVGRHPEQLGFRLASGNQGDEFP
ncbi:MAG: PAS domain-containing protein [Planctomycetaceae bacterium]|jgi:PAS domain-containing protein